MYHYFNLVKSRVHNKLLSFFLHGLSLPSFIYGCNNIGRYNGNGNDYNWELQNFIDKKKNDENDTLSLLDAIKNDKRKTIESIKIADYSKDKQQTPEELKNSNSYNILIAMLKAKDEDGNTPLHLLVSIISSENCDKVRYYRSLFKLFINYLPQAAISEILNIENKESMNVLEFATKHKNIFCIDTLGNKKLILEKEAEHAKNVIDAMNKGIIPVALVFNSIKYKNLAIFEYGFQNTDITKLFLEKNEQDKTIFHIGSEMCESSSKDTKHIFARILYNIEKMPAESSQKNNLKQSISKYLNETNNEDLNIIDILTRNGCISCLEKLKQYGYTIELNTANCAIIRVDGNPNNPAVKFLMEEYNIDLLETVSYKPDMSNDDQTDMSIKRSYEQKKGVNKRIKKEENMSPLKIHLRTHTEKNRTNVCGKKKMVQHVTEFSINYIT